MIAARNGRWILWVALLGALLNVRPSLRNPAAFPDWSLRGVEGDFLLADPFYFDGHGLRLKDYREVHRPLPDGLTSLQLRFRLDQPGSHLVLGWGCEDRSAPFVRFGSALSHPTARLVYRSGEALEHEPLEADALATPGEWHTAAVHCESSSCAVTLDGRELTSLPPPQPGDRLRIGSGLRPIHLARVEGRGAKSDMTGNFRNPSIERSFDALRNAFFHGLAIRLLPVLLLGALLQPWRSRGRWVPFESAPWVVAGLLAGFPGSLPLRIAILGVGAAVSAYWVGLTLASPPRRDEIGAAVSLLRVILTVVAAVATAAGIMAVASLPGRRIPASVRNPSPETMAIDRLDLRPTRPWFPTDRLWRNFRWEGEAYAQAGSYWEWRFGGNHCDADGNRCRHGYSAWGSSWKGPGTGLARRRLGLYEVVVESQPPWPVERWVPFRLEVEGDRARLEMEGHPAWETALPSNPSYPSGLLGLIVHRGGLDVRHLRVVPLDDRSLPLRNRAPLAFLMLPWLFFFASMGKPHRRLSESARATHQILSLFGVSMAALTATTVVHWQPHHLNPLGGVGPALVLIGASALVRRFAEGPRYFRRFVQPMLLVGLAWVGLETAWTGLGLEAWARTYRDRGALSPDRAFEVESPAFRRLNSFLGDGTLRFRQVPDRSDGSLRVLMLGGSSVFGAGLSGENSEYAALLQPEGLRREMPFSVVGINGAKSQATAFEMAHLFDALYAEAVRPDWVVLVGGFNDTWREYSRSGGPGLWSRLGSGAAPADSFGFMPVLWREFLNRVRWRDGSEELADYRRSLEFLIESARRHRIRLLLVTEPMAPDFVGEDPVDRRHTVMRETAAEAGVPLLDLRERMRRLPNHRFFLDAVHPNAQGHRFIAGELLEFLRSEVGKEP